MPLDVAVDEPTARMRNATCAKSVSQLTTSAMPLRIADLRDLAVMPHYRVYSTTPDGHVTVPAAVIECDDDQQAIEKTAQLRNGKTLELWEGARFVGRFPGHD
jgi:hypothetical protein